MLGFVLRLNSPYQQVGEACPVTAGILNPSSRWGYVHLNVHPSVRSFGTRGFEVPKGIEGFFARGVLLGLSWLGVGRSASLGLASASSRFRHTSVIQELHCDKGQVRRRCQAPDPLWEGHFGGELGWRRSRGRF